MTEAEKVEATQEDREAAINFVTALGFPHLVNLFSEDMDARDVDAENALAVLARHRRTHTAGDVEPVRELAAMLDAVTFEEGAVIFEHTAEEIGLHVMENYQAIQKALYAPKADGDKK